MAKRKKVRKEQDRKILEKGEVSLLLDDYDDIFSDFDPRPYSVKSLSVDFLEEAKRATREVKMGKFGVNFLVPSSKKNMDKEKNIKNRLKDHFKKHADLLKKEWKKIIMQGVYFLGAGILFMVAASYILFFYHAEISFLKELLVVMLEPGGWFLFWEGLDLMIFEQKRINPDLTFYQKMTKAEIVFSHY